MSKRKQRKAHEAELRMKFKDDSPQAVKLPPRMDTKTARAIIEATRLEFSCTPEEVAEKLATQLTQVLRWYAIDQQQSKLFTRIWNDRPPINRRRLREFIGLSTEELRTRPIPTIRGTEEEERERLKVLNSGPIPYDPETSGYDWYSPATDRMNAFEREELGILNAKPDKKTNRRARKLLDKTPKDKGGRPENWALRSLVLRLADIYEDCTGRKAGASINRTGDIVGPFVRFAATVIDPSDPYLPRAVLAALQARKKVQ